MNLKSILFVTLLVTLLIALVNKGYLTYAIYVDPTNQTGDKFVLSNKWMFILDATIHCLAMVLAATLYLKQN